MNSILQYRPAFFEGFKNERADFDTVEELMKVPFVKGFSEDENFFRFSVSGDHLLAEFRNGDEWWVVGTLKEPVDGLPEWREPK